MKRVQSVDQAGFTSGFSCDDHLFTVAMLHEKMAAWQEELWIVAIDFKKTFDSVEHRAIWEALQELGVPMLYVHLLKHMYEGQTGRVVADAVSKRSALAGARSKGIPSAQHCSMQFSK